MRLIDADALKASIEEKDRYNLGGERRIVVCGMLDDAPTIDAEPVKHGYWIVADDGVTRCSICYGASDYERSFCGDCGAKMDLKDSESK